jgi:hypothetical protein
MIDIAMDIGFDARGGLQPYEADRLGGVIKWLVGIGGRAMLR